MFLDVISCLTWCHRWYQGRNFSTTATAVDVLYSFRDRVLPDQSRRGYFLRRRRVPSSSDFVIDFLSIMLLGSLRTNMVLICI